MEGGEIGSIIARVVELQCKINNCIDRCGANNGGGENSEDDDDAESESLFGIRDALESLEKHLASLQDLQQQQRYEREATIAQIDRSRKILLSKLKDYKGEDLEVIHEALTFAGETVERDDSLLLPPYPSHLPDLFVLDDLYPSSHFTPKYLLSQIGPTGNRPKKSTDESDKHKHTSENRPKGIRIILGVFVKSVITFVSVVSLLSLAGFKPSLRKRGTRFRVSEFHNPGSEEGSTSIQCPPGKVLVIEDGKARCLVKERTEIPFESDVTAPNICYGFG